VLVSTGEICQGVSITAVASGFSAFLLCPMVLDSWITVRRAAEMAFRVVGTVANISAGSLFDVFSKEVLRR
jgi:hypothetical protein